MNRSVVFDLDGTLIDSLPDLHVAANRVLADFGAAPLDLPVLRGFIGHGVPSLVAQVRRARGLPDGLQDQMTAAMLRHYLAAPADLTRPYPGVIDALLRLRAEGYRVGLCTNKAMALTTAILATLNMAHLFDAVIGGDSLPQRKPHPAPLHAAFAATGGVPLAFIGDSEVDAETAVAAGLPFGLYTEGYRKAPVADVPHRFAFADFGDLAGLLAGLP